MSMPNVYMNFPEKFRDKLMDKFKKEMVTTSAMDTSLDGLFTGTRTVHIPTIVTTPLEKYNRTLDPTNESRYGQTREVGDTMDTYTITQDVSFKSSRDNGFLAEQDGIKTAQEIINAYKDERINPFLDEYRLNKWVKEAGNHFELSTDLTRENIVQEIIKITSRVRNTGAPRTGYTLFVSGDYEEELLLSPLWNGLDSLGSKSLPHGQIGQIGGVPIKIVYAGGMPGNAPILLANKRSIIAPTKLRSLRVITNSENIDGTLVVFRMLTDAFVIGARANGVGALCKKGTVVAAPTFSGTSSITISTTTTGATIYYTLDGSDPRYSANKKTYTAAVTLASGDVLKAYADKDGMFSSAVSTK